jgi:GNAT superfamily N-acetyltransferase
VGWATRHLDPRGARGDRTLSIRASGPDEAETLLALQRAASLAGLAHIYPPEQYPYPDDAIRERWQTFPGRVLLVEEDGVPVGIAAVDDCWLHGFYVVPERWGSGVADALHDAALAALACAEAKLWVLEENHRARRFYEKRGWVQNGETRVVEYPPYPLDLGYSLTTKEP